MKKYFLACTIGLIAVLVLGLRCRAQEAPDYPKKAWPLRGAKKYKEAYAVIDACIADLSQDADRMAKSLNDFVPEGKVDNYQPMNDVAECYFIKAEALRDEGKLKEAAETFGLIADKYPFAQGFDERGWYWKIAEAAKDAICEIYPDSCEDVLPPVEDHIPVVLYDEGAEFPVDYEKYGRFEAEGTKDYSYVVVDPIGLSKAVGEGIHPNTSSIKFDPDYVKLKKQLGSVDHWKILNSRNLKLAFYKWNFAPEPAGVRQFNIADILERSELLKQAVKAYYAILVHYPRAYGWTYWQTPWYVAKVALYRLKYILNEHPELGLQLEGASVQVINGYDNDIRNDEYVVSPGRLVALSFWDKAFTSSNCAKQGRKLKKLRESGGEGVKLIEYESGDWQLFVDGKPFIIKGITYAPTRVGESPDDGTMQNWTTQDVNENGIVDAPFESWVDKNCNNIQDEEEQTVGDLRLMKEMGVNALRVYHQPYELNKKIFRQIYEKYGIYILLGDFLGKYALGSGASWDPGTDYDNPEHKQKMLESVEKMVLEFKDEPYVLIWLLGNENVYGLGCNANKKPESFFKFANEAARLIKSLDPQKRPVAIVSGDILYLDIFGEHCPDIDIFGTNAYRGKYGFLDIWDEVKRVAGKAAMITEFGTSSFAKGYTQQEGQDYQAQYHRACWLDIACNSAGFSAGNAIGGVVFEWLDEWWKAYKPNYHDWKGLFAGPFLDGFMHEEWLGIVGQGQGKHSPYLRQLKKAYYTYKELWAHN
jgi:beta-glucuronidase